MGTGAAADEAAAAAAVEVVKRAGAVGAPAGGSSRVRPVALARLERRAYIVTPPQKKTQPAVTKHLPSNDFRFQRGGSEGARAGAGRGQEESDDLRAYSIRCWGDSTFVVVDRLFDNKRTHISLSLRASLFFQTAPTRGRPRTTRAGGRATRRRQWDPRGRRGASSCRP